MTMVNKRGVRNSAPILISIAIIVLLVLAGPAQAISLNLNLDHGPYELGEDVNFLAEVDMEGNEIIEIENISLIINEEIACIFDIFGDSIDLCEGINVELVIDPVIVDEETHTGYGYGAIDDKLIYNITLSTLNELFNLPGNNDLKIIVNTGEEEIISEIEKMQIKPDTPNSNSKTNNERKTHGTFLNLGLINSSTPIQKLSTTNTLKENVNEDANGNVIQTEKNENRTTSNEEAKVKSSSITGAVLGAIGGAGWVISILLLVVLVISYISIRVLRANRAITPMY